MGASDLPEGLPEEVLAALGEHPTLNAETLAALSAALVGKRTEAVTSRKDSGIEDIWTGAEESYLGVDDSNRSEFAGARWIKPMTMSGPVTTTDRRPVEGEVRSNAFVRLTSRYVDAGAAKLGEILIQSDDKSFSFDATPVPDLVAARGDSRQIHQNGVPLERDARPGELPPTPGAALSTTGQPQGSAPGSPIGAAPGTTVPLTVKDIVEEAIDKAQTAAKKAERRIYDWMVEAQYAGEMRKVIFDAARLGVGVLKAPFPTMRKSMALREGDGGITVEVEQKLVPDYKWKDPWDIFPHPACGENIHNGDWLWERDFFSLKQVRELKKDPSYIASAIDMVIAEGPQKVNLVDGRASLAAQKNKHQYQVWYFYGAITREEILATASTTVAAGIPKNAKECFAICTMINDTVVKAVLNPLDSGSFPFHSVPWQRRAGNWAGVGVAEQIRMPQRMINSATRALLNNAGKSAGSIIVLDQGSITPADTKWALTPDKIFYKAPDATIDDVRKAFVTFQVPNMGPPLMAIVEYALRLAEESTSIPLVTQGQSGPTSPQTYGAAQLQNNNANQLLRSIGYAFDDFITEPVVRQSYEWLLLDPSVPDDEKGDFKINAHGSIALVERAIEDQTIQMMGQFAINPAFGVDPKRWFAEFSKSKHLRPKDFQYSDDEQARIDATPKPMAPQVEVAQIRSKDAQAKLAADQAGDQADAALARELGKESGDVVLATAHMKSETERQRIQRDTDRDTIYVKAEQERTKGEYDARMRELEIRRELAILDYANKKDLKLDEVKAALADTAMKLRVQKELAGAEHAVDIHKHHNPPPVIEPPTEPPGTAAPGKAFTQ